MVLLLQRCHLTCIFTAEFSQKNVLEKSLVKLLSVNYKVTITQFSLIMHSALYTPSTPETPA